jgi:hypothetical protein
MFLKEREIESLRRMRWDYCTLKYYALDVDIGFWVGISELLHLVLLVNQLDCAVPESDGLSHGNRELRLLISYEFSPHNHSQEG